MVSAPRGVPWKPLMCVAWTPHIRGSGMLELVFEAQGEEIRVSPVGSLDVLGLGELLDGVASVEEDMVPADVQSEVFVPLVGGADAGPDPVGVGEHDGLVFLLGDGALVEGGAAAQGSLVGELVLSAEGEAPGVMPFHHLGVLGHQRTSLEDGGHLLHDAPLGPGNVRHQGQLVGDLLLDAEVHILGHVNFMVAWSL